MAVTWSVLGSTSMNGVTLATTTTASNHVFTWTYRDFCKKRGAKEGAVKGQAVYHLTEGNWFVKGTVDHDEVRQLLAEHEDVQDQAPEDCDWEVSLIQPEAGWWRFVPCSCGDHGWHVVHARGKGRGAFQGVLLEAYPQPVEFDVDAALDDPWLDQ